jgi:hypothetical protein
MQISVDTCLPFPRDLVYRTYRDRLVEVLPQLPNIKQVTRVKYREVPPITHCVYEWEGGADIPGLVQSLIPPTLLHWTEVDDWYEPRFEVSWRITPHAFQSAIQCNGCNQFIDQGDQTLIQNRGTLTIQTDQLTTVPLPMRGTVAAIAEKILGQAIAPNLKTMGGGIAALLARESTLEG